MINHNSPLANKIRPKSINEIIGQKHLTDSGKLLHSLITNHQPSSIIFWGPPGTGKTTLAHIYAESLDANIISISAVTSGVKDIKSAVEIAKNYLSKNQKTIIIIDEIHRFSKSQQDYLLPHIEDGTLILIGATTENPSFQINNALLSRTRVITLNSLELKDIEIIIQKASFTSTGLNIPESKLKPTNITLIAELANGDARSAINILELSHKLANNQEITRDHILESAQQKSLYYDRQGDEHYNTISAFIKSMRASQIDSALYYMTRMLEGGEDPLYIARRMIIFASEDIGIANNNALLLTNQIFQAVHQLGLPEASIPLSHGVVYLCQSPKNRDCYDALQNAKQDIHTFGNLPIPLQILNAPTKLMKELNYGKNYQMYNTNSYLPKKLKNKKYFKSTLTKK